MPVDELTLTQRIERVVRPHLKFLSQESSVAPDQSLGDLGLDSLASINLLFDLESEFGVTIPDEAVDENTFSSLAHLETAVKQAFEA